MNQLEFINETPDMMFLEKFQQQNHWQFFVNQSKIRDIR